MFTARRVLLWTLGLFFVIAAISVAQTEKTKPEYILKADQLVAMNDGIKLATDVYLPKEDGQFPCILIRTPYNKDGHKGDGERFAKQGYAVVIQDTRGKMKSEGTFYPFRHDRADGLTTVKWIRTQPWYAGKIGGWGGSYVGFTQWAIADELDAMIPTVTCRDMYDVLYPSGLMSLATAINWGLPVDSKTMNPIKPEKLMAAYRILPLSVADDSTFKDNAFFDDWLAHSSRDEYWQAMTHTRPPKGAVLSVAGWFDIFLQAQIADFLALPKYLQHASRMVIGPWAHGKLAAEMDYTEKSKLKHANKLAEQVYAHTLQGKSITAIAEPYTDHHYNLFIMQRNEWYGCDEWPPAKMTAKKLYLAADSALTFDQPAKSGFGSYTYDPSDPYPSLGGTLLGVGVGQAWQNPNLSRTDQLSFSTAVLDQPLTLLGPLSANLFVQTDAPATDFIVCLQDVFPDGKILNIQEGGRSVSAKELKGKDQPAEILVDVWATGYELPAGHKLRVVVTSSWFPRYNRNLNSGQPLATASEMRKAKQTLYWGGKYPSYVSLPVLAE